VSGRPFFHTRPKSEEYRSETALSDLAIAVDEGLDAAGFKLTLQRAVKPIGRVRPLRSDRKWTVGG
jgi:3-dehydroquinate dehydratase